MRQSPSSQGGGVGRGNIGGQKCALQTDLIVEIWSHKSAHSGVGSPGQRQTEKVVEGWGGRPNLVVRRLRKKTEINDFGKC